MNISTPIAVQINCWRAPLSGGSLIKSIRWIITRPRPLSKITQGRITGSAYGAATGPQCAQVRRAGWRCPPRRESSAQLTSDIDVDQRVCPECQPSAKMIRANSTPRRFRGTTVTGATARMVAARLRLPCDGRRRCRGWLTAGLLLGVGFAPVVGFAVRRRCGLAHLFCSVGQLRDRGTGRVQAGDIDIGFDLS